MSKISFLSGIFFIVGSTNGYGCADMPLSQVMGYIIDKVQHAPSESCLRAIETYKEYIDLRSMRDKNNNSLLQLVLGRSKCTPELLERVIEISDPLDVLHQNIYGETIVEAVLAWQSDHEILIKLRERIILLCICSCTQSIIHDLSCKQKQIEQEAGDELRALSEPATTTRYSAYFAATEDSPGREIPQIKTYNSADLINPRVPTGKERQISLAQRYKSSPQFKNRDSDA